MSKIKINLGRIGVIAPAHGDPTCITKLLTYKEMLEHQGISISYTDGFLDGDDKTIPGITLPYANTEEFRQADFKKALTSYSVIHAYRGGEGCAELYEEVLALNVTDITLIGFSDLTVFHALFNKIYKLPTIHGPVISTFLSNENDFSIFKDILSGQTKTYNIKVMPKSTDIREIESYDLYGKKVAEALPVADPSEASASGRITGSVIGGNLSLVRDLLGTPLELNCAGKFLLLEDIGSAGRHVKKALQHLMQQTSGIINGCKAVLFGDFTNCEDYFLEPMVQIMVNKLADKGIPSYRIPGIGHGPVNKPIVLGSNAYIEGDVLTVESPFVLSSDEVHIGGAAGACSVGTEG